MKTFKEILDSEINKSKVETENRHPQNKEIHKNNYVGVGYTTCLDYGYRPYKK